MTLYERRLSLVERYERRQWFRSGRSPRRLVGDVARSWTAHEGDPLRPGRALCGRRVLDEGEPGEGEACDVCRHCRLARDRR